jgi:hypothetical protein
VWLVLADDGDEGAVWAVDGLRHVGLDPVELFTPDALGGGRWAHRLGRGGNGVEAHFPDGRVLRSRATRGVLNRLTGRPPTSLQSGRAADHAYAAQEWHAFVLGWMQAFEGPVVNRASPRGLCGAWRYLGEWRLLAHRAGLAAAPYRTGSPPDTASTRALVVGRDAFVPERLAGSGAEFVRLASLARTPLLDVYLSVEDGRAAVVGGSPLPDLRAGGEAALAALARLLTGPAPAGS